MHWVTQERTQAKPKSYLQTVSMHLFYDEADRGFRVSKIADEAHDSSKVPKVPADVLTKSR